MKRTILLVSFGTRYRQASEKSLDKIAYDLSEASGLKVYQAYTSPRIKDRLEKEGIRVYNINEAVHKAADEKTDELLVISTHIIAGHEYNKMLSALKQYEHLFSALKAAKPLLYTEKDCENAVSVLDGILDFSRSNEYIFMGHGTDAEANVMYTVLNDAFAKKGFTNAHIAVVEESPTLDEAMRLMRGSKEVDKVILHPFMMVAGDHALNDMAGENNSFLARLEASGYNAVPVLRGLGEYRQFRDIYVEKMKKLLES